MGLFYKKCTICGKEQDKSYMDKVKDLGFVCSECSRLVKTWANRNNKWPESRDDYLYYYQLGMEMRKKQAAFEQEIQKRKQKWFDEFKEAYSIGPLSLDIKHGLLGYRTLSNFRMKFCNHCLGTVDSAVLFPISVIRSMEASEGSLNEAKHYRNEHIDRGGQSNWVFCLSVKTDFGEYCFHAIEDLPNITREEHSFNGTTYYREVPPGILRFIIQTQFAARNIVYTDLYEGHIKPEVDAFHNYLTAHQTEWGEIFRGDMNCGNILYLDKKHGLLACYYDDPNLFFALCERNGRIKEKHKNSSKLKIYPTNSIRGFRYYNYGSGDCSENGVNRQVLDIETDVEHIAFFLSEKWSRDWKTGDSSIPSLESLLREVVRMNKGE